VLVSGSDSAGVGYIVEIGFSVAGGVVVSAINDLSVLGVVVPDLVWGEGNSIVVADFSTLSILAGDVSLGLSSLSLQWVGGPSVLPILDGSTTPLLDLYSDSGYPGKCVAAYGDDFAVFSAPRYLIHDPGGLWQVSPIVDVVTSSDVWAMDMVPVLSTHETAYEIHVVGGTGAFVVKDTDTGATVFVGNHSVSPAGSEETFSVPGVSLAYGHRYHIESAGSQSTVASVPIRMFQRWGRESGPTSITAYEPIYAIWNYPSAGFETIACAAWTAPHSSLSAFVWCAVAPWDYGVSPTVATPLGVSLLVNQFGTLGPVQFYAEDSGRLGAAFSFDANSPMLAGLRVAFQFVGLLSTSEFYVSDVQGVILQ